MAVALLVMVALVAAATSMAVRVSTAKARECPPLHYWFDATAAPLVAEDIDAAFMSLSAVTGIDVVNDSVGGLVGRAHRGGVRIEFDTSGELGPPTGRRLLGRAVTILDRRGPISGVVTLNLAAPPPASRTGSVTWRHVMMHELGHLLHLGHSADPADLMYPTLNAPAHDWSPVDIDRLRRASAEFGCQPPRSNSS